MRLSRPLPIELIKMILEIFCQELIERYQKVQYLEMDYSMSKGLYFPLYTNRHRRPGIGRPLTDYLNCRLACTMFNDIINKVVVHYRAYFYQRSVWYSDPVRDALDTTQADLLIYYSNATHDLRGFDRFDRQLRDLGVGGNIWKNYFVIHNQDFFTNLLLKANRQDRAILLSLASEWLEQCDDFESLQSRKHLPVYEILLVKKRTVSAFSLQIRPYGIVNKYFALYILKGITCVSLRHRSQTNFRNVAKMRIRSSLPTNAQIQSSRGHWWIFQNRDDPLREWDIINPQEKKLYVGPEGNLAPFHSSWPRTT